MLCATEARAHGEADDPLPPAPGLGWEAAAALRTLNADQTLPSNRLDGYLLQGDAGMDPDGTQLEHGALGLAARFNDTWGARLVVGKHGSEAAEAEEAWLQARHDADNGDVWHLNAGRQRPAMGAVLSAAGHFDRFGLMPLAQRMAFDHDWVDDGLQLGWRREAGSMQLRADAGLWRGRAFPGARSGRLVPSVHGGLSRGPWALDAMVASFRPEGRGSAIAGAAGHSHHAPVCDTTLIQVVCFGGSSEVAAASVRWSGREAPHPWPVTLTAAGWLRNDTGTLESANGLVDYRGRNRGGWVEAVWHLAPSVELGWRGEHLRASHALRGSGASLLSTETRLNAYAPATRHALMLGYLPKEGVELRVEAGRESVAGTRVNFAALRLVLRASAATGF